MASFALQRLFLPVPPSTTQESHLSPSLLLSSVSFLSQRNAIGATRCGCGAPSSSRRRRKALAFHSSTKGPYSRYMTLTAVGSGVVSPSGESVSGMQTPEVSDQLGKEKHGTTKEDESSAEELDDSKMVKVCDKLIDVFLVDKPSPTDWRRMLAFSREWDNIRPHFFQRCQDKADAEGDSGMKHKLLRLGRKLKEVDDDVKRHNELIQVMKASPSASDISEIVARRRKDFTQEFFEHLHAVVESYYNDPTEQNALAKLAGTCLASVQTYDNASESIEALNAAELKFEDILNSPTLDVACRKIDDLAGKKELDSALMLMLTKAWSSAKESSMVKDEAKDILYHLYMTARDNMQRLMPKEILIVKYLLTIDDPEELSSALEDAFTPGEDVDSLYTTPEKLFTWIHTVVDAYQFSREGSLVKEARDLMNPKIISKLKDLQKVLQDRFL